MKTIIIVLLILPFSLFGQSTPFKGAQKVVINNTLTAKDNFDLAVKTLLDNDYFIESKNAELYTIKTQPRQVNKHTGLYFLNIRSRDNGIEVSGMFKSGIELNISGVNSTDNYEPIVSRGGLYKVAFNNMNEFSMKLGPVTYK